MLRSLYFKIVLILLVFIVAVMCAVGAILINGVTSFYANDFSEQMQRSFDSSGVLMNDLRQAAQGENSAYGMKQILVSYGSLLGIDEYRNYYILSSDGDVIVGSEEIDGGLEMTPNLLAAVSGYEKNITSGGMDYSDWVVRISYGEDDAFLVYIKDSLVEMRNLNRVLFTIILIAMVIGIFIAVLLSFFLAKSISSPLQSLTYGTQLVASGEFTYDIDVRSEDEIGVLAENFNYMRDKLKNTLEEVEGEREKLDTVLSCMRDAVVAFTASGKVLHSNSSAAELFGDEIKKGTLTLEKCFELLDLPLMIVGNSIKLSSPDVGYESTKDGFVFRDRICASRVYDVSFAVIRYTEGRRQSFGCVIVTHDVTGRYELDESRREFVANVSHELRTPLTSIKGATETILRDEEMDAETRGYFLDMVLSESDRMTRIVSDLLVMSRLDNNRMKWTIEKFDIRQSVRRLCDVMRSDLEAHSHRMTFGSDKKLPEITADRQRIEQVIINVISNAIKYTKDGGIIDVRVTNASDGYVSVKVTDNGIGIPKEDIAHLFERFYRVEKSRNQDAGGTGLGLAIAKEIIESHGGRIEVESKVGEGTSVTVTLPVECKIREEGSDRTRVRSAR